MGLEAIIDSLGGEEEIIGVGEKVEEGVKEEEFVTFLSGILTLYCKEFIICGETAAIGFCATKVALVDGFG